MEIAATGMLNRKNLTYFRFIQGDVGTQDGCSWDSGNLLKKSYLESTFFNCEVSLGHTHPTFISGGFGKRKMYGAIPSRIPYKNKKDVEEYVHDPYIAQKIIDSKLYKKYRGDYVDTIIRSKFIPKISNFSWILSPALNQLGIFQVKNGGKVIFYP